MQEAYNKEHGITPETIRKAIRSGIEADVRAHREANEAVGRDDEAQYITEEFLEELEGEMLAAAESLEFERAAALRDRIEQMRASMGKRVDEVEVRSFSRQGRGKSKKGKGKGGARLPRPKRP
jgi:excinuclease ABC subunit B